MGHSKPVRGKAAPTGPDKSGSKPRGGSVYLFLEFTIVHCVKRKNAAGEKKGRPENEEKGESVSKGGRERVFCSLPVSMFTRFPVFSFSRLPTTSQLSPSDRRLAQGSCPPGGDSCCKNRAKPARLTCR